MEEKPHIGDAIIDRLEEGKPLKPKDLDTDEKTGLVTEEDLIKYQKIWDSAPAAAQHRKFNQDNAWNKVNQEIGSRQIRIRRLNNLLYAASGVAATLLVILGLSFYLGYFSSSTDNITVATAYGSRSKIILPDGSHVKLNAGSTLKYHTDQFNKIRKVDFNGEALFEVAKKNTPFVIETSDGLSIKVLGTKFNLRTYSEDEIEQTSLLEGRIELSHPGAKSLILRPGQVASFNKKTKSLEYDQSDVVKNLGWIHNKLFMDGMSLNEVCVRLERWYDVKITLSDEALGDKIHYTGILKEQTVSDVLDALCRLSTIEYKLKGKKIIISERPLNQQEKQKPI